MGRVARALSAIVERMRNAVHAERIRQFMRRLGREARGSGTVFLTGGATALLVGWRDATLDIDLSMDPEPEGIFEAIARIKEDLDLNIDLASPADFVPALPGWRDRCLFIERHGEVDFFHFDPYTQALSKIERGHGRDLEDAQQMVRRGLVEPKLLSALFERVEPELIRYPAIDPVELRRKLSEFVSAAGDSA